MIRFLCRTGFALFLAGIAASSSWAADKGPIVADNVLGGAASGALVGLSAGMLAYGLDNNYHPQVLVTSTVYGFLSGAVLGGGVAAYEITTNRMDAGPTLTDYLAGGTSIGALVGVVGAAIPYMRDKHQEDFTIGLGLGGVIGAAFGLTFAAIDISSRHEGKELLSGQIGLLEVSSYLPPVVPGLEGEAILNCRLVKLTF